MRNFDEHEKSFLEMHKTAMAYKKPLFHYLKASLEKIKFIASEACFIIRLANLVIGGIIKLIFNEAYFD